MPKPKTQRLSNFLTFCSKPKLKEIIIEKIFMIIFSEKKDLTGSELI